MRAPGAAQKAGGDVLNSKVEKMREWLHKSQSITDTMVSILGSFNHRLSALETAIRPIQEVSDGHSSHHQSEDPIEPPSVFYLYCCKVGMVVHLFNFGLPKKVVAEGIIIAKDPCKEVGGVPLGYGF